MHHGRARCRRPRRSTGLRISEALALQCNDLSDDSLIVRNGRFGKQRLLPLHPTARETLGAYLAVRAKLGATGNDLFVVTTGRAPHKVVAHSTKRKRSAAVSAAEPAFRPIGAASPHRARSRRLAERSSDRRRAACRLRSPREKRCPTMHPVVPRMIGSSAHHSLTPGQVNIGGSASSASRSPRCGPADTWMRKSPGVTLPAWVQRR
ncbi:MAG: tyrosine-type recombinase/integrase [Sphingopyxis sp.]|nr:tyrosine-type recombinase/integrase [Sphingopyxis sp.]